MVKKTTKSTVPVDGKWSRQLGRPGDWLGDRGIRRR